MEDTRRRLLGPIILGLAAMSPAAAQCSNVESQALEAIDHAWSEATSRGDRAQLQSIIADDYEGAAITGTVNKASTIDDAVRAAERNRTNPQGVPKTVYGNYVITCTPNSAVVTHLNTITATVNGRYAAVRHVLSWRRAYGITAPPPSRSDI